jgi:hypothetical protein
MKKKNRSRFHSMLQLERKLVSILNIPDCSFQ